MDERPEQHETGYSEHIDEASSPQPPAPDNDDPTRPSSEPTAYDEYADESEEVEGPEANPS